jgi:hypothetical protein
MVIIRNCDGGTGHPGRHVRGTWAAVTVLTESLKAAGAAAVVVVDGGTVVVAGGMAVEVVA